MPKYKTRFSPLQLELTMILLAVVTIVLVLQGVYDYRVLKREYAQELQEDLVNIQARLKAGLRYPYWNLDRVSVSNIVRSEMARKDIYGVLIYDVDDTLYAGWGRDQDWHVVSISAAPASDRGLLSARTPVSFRGEPLGYFTVFLTDRFNKLALQEKLKHVFLVIALVDTFLLLVLFASLRALLVQPLVQMSSFLSTLIKERDFEMRLPGSKRADELGTLYKMINLLLAEISRSQKELTKANMALEDKVLERTRELESANKELMEAKERAESAARAKSQFLANMSHEIRTPMNAVIGLADLALQRAVHPKIKQYLNIIRSSSKSLLTLLNDILDLSKVEAGKIAISLEEVNLEELLEEVADIFLDQFASNNLEFIVNMDPALPKLIQTDGYRVRQILINLLGNALKFTEQGEVLLKVRVQERQGDQVVLLFQVQDTGVGIPKEHQENLFDVFEQVEGGYDRKFGGTGLGLAISKRLVEFLGGEIWVESSPGLGSTFFFTIKARVLDEGGRELPAVFKAKQVVVYEPHLGQQEVLDQMLTSFGLKVFKASSLGELQSHLRALECKPDLMTFDLTDLGELEPVQQGAEGKRLVAQNGILKSIEKLNAEFSLAAVPKALLCSIRQELDVSHLKDLGIRGVLTKPMTGSRLFDFLLEIFVGLGPRGNEVEEKKADIRNESPTKQVNIQARVLVVEDNPINQQVAREMLEALGVEVDLAESGFQALQWLEQVHYDLVFMDVQMPGMDGLEATRLIRSKIGLTELPIVAMTAHALSGDKEMCLQAGMNDYVSKPVEQETLKGVLAKWLPAETLQAKDRNGSLSPEHDVALPVLQGLDVSWGLARVQGQANLYLRLVEELGAQVQDFYSALQAEQLTFDELKVRMHDLKGSCANLGAFGLAHKLEQQEEVLTASGTADFKMLVQELSAEVELVLQGLEKASQALQGKPGQLVPEFELSDVQLVLQKILQKVEDMDPVGLEDLLARLDSFSFTESRPVGRQFKDRVTELRQTLSNFDFDQAREKVEKLSQLILKD